MEDYGNPDKLNSKLSCWSCFSYFPSFYYGTSILEGIEITVKKQKPSWAFFAY